MTCFLYSISLLRAKTDCTVRSFCKLFLTVPPTTLGSMAHSLYSTSGALKQQFTNLAILFILSPSRSLQMRTFGNSVVPLGEEGGEVPRRAERRHADPLRLLQRTQIV